MAPHKKLKIPYVRPIKEALNTVLARRSGTYIPRDILKPLPTDKITPAISMRKKDFICLNYMKVIKKICLFFLTKSL
jgi:hypothetical protein|tara:strand:+ start:1301 stop:1531 length:231 start_codon:yes stop_codon:yes gene_type:complete